MLHLSSLALDKYVNVYLRFKVPNGLHRVLQVMAVVENEHTVMSAPGKVT